MANNNSTVTNPDINNKVTEIDSSTVIIELESSIKSHIDLIDKNKAEIKKMREMLQSALLNDEVYKSHELAAKDANKIKSSTKTNLMKAPQNYEISAKLKDTVSQTREMEEALSDYLREYHRISGSSEIETSQGDVREIVYVAKLVKKSSRRK